jgi:hypothetical protein
MKKNQMNIRKTFFISGVLILNEIHNKIYGKDIATIITDDFP